MRSTIVQHIWNITFGINVLEQLCGGHLLRVSTRVRQDNYVPRPNKYKVNIRQNFDEEAVSELLHLHNKKVDLSNKLWEDLVSSILKRMWFNELYDRCVRAMYDISFFCHPNTLSNQAGNHFRPEQKW